MFNIVKDEFEETPEDIINSINKILNNDKNCNKQENEKKQENN